jgi:hypothetical protein
MWEDFVYETLPAVLVAALVLAIAMLIGAVAYRIAVCL